MARSRTPPLTLESRQLTADELSLGIQRLRKRLSELEAFKTSDISTQRPPELVALEKSIESALGKTFGMNTPEWRRYVDAFELLWSPTMFFGHQETPLSEYQREITKNVENSRILLREAIGGLEEDLEEVSAARPAQMLQHDVDHSRNNKVFLVHGHDDGAKQTVARYMEKIGFDPIILHEQPNAGQTIIEKFEKHSDVGFAIVLLTPDDIGGVSPDALRPRARQNVILELGYFVGRLTRKRVCALMLGDVEVPSDFAGVVYEQIDPAGAWKQMLARELQEAGYAIDWNKVMSK